MRGKAHSDELKAQVLAALLAGGHVSDVSKQFNIDRTTIYAWQKKNPSDLLSSVEPEKKHDLGNLVATYLQETLLTLAVQVRFARSESWLEKQSASELAILHGVLADKGIRLLEAAQAALDAADGSEYRPAVS